MRRFSHFACLDWSGAKGERQKGIALATCAAGRDAPGLMTRERGWSRAAIVDWLLEQAAARADMLVGIDFSPSLPFEDEGCFFPAWDRSPATARALWRFVDDLAAADPHFAAGSFIAHEEAGRYFRHGRTTGDRFPGGLGRMRVVEAEAARLKLANPASCFNLVGAKQVGKSSLSGMRVLHHLDGRIPIWPFDPVPAEGPLIVEIYTSIAAFEAGRPRNRAKMPDGASLNAALDRVDSAPHPGAARLDDHSTDAILTAAWLRRASVRGALWSPPRLTPALARTEGWTFGVP